MVPVIVRCSVLTLENTLSWAAEIAENFSFSFSFFLLYNAVKPWESEHLDPKPSKYVDFGWFY